MAAGATAAAAGDGLAAVVVVACLFEGVTPPAGAAAAGRFVPAAVDGDGTPADGEGSILHGGKRAAGIQSAEGLARRIGGGSQEKKNNG